MCAQVFPLMTRIEPTERQGDRRQLLAGLAGRVLEIGAGTGLTFAFYPPTVSEVVAVEPEPRLRTLAARAAAQAPVPITVVDGFAEDLPAPDASFDAAVSCIVLCTVTDQARTLAELRRVLRPGSQLRYYEYALSHTLPIALTQHLTDRIGWPLLGGGCHVVRVTSAAIAAAGFTIEHERRQWVGPRWALLLGTHVIGTARAA
jgi:ubiquinone/menaquinone biosynthesis C-methylase UbiE